MRIGGLPRAQPRMGDDVGEALVGGRDAGPGVTITGQTPPAGPKVWWWLAGLGALVGLWFLVRDDVRKEGRRVLRPFAA